MSFNFGFDFSDKRRLSSGGTSFDYYVASSGSNSNPGTMAQPFQTVQHAMDVSSSGKRIGLNGGDAFPENVLITSPRTIGSYGTGKATLNPHSGHAVSILNTSDVSVSRLVIVGTDETPYSTTSGNYENLLPAGVFFKNDTGGTTRYSGISVSDCDISHFVTGCFARVENGTTSGTDGFTLKRNEIHHCSGNGFMCWDDVGASATRHVNLLVEDNVIHDITGYSIQTSGIPLALGMCTGTVRRNRLFDSGYNSTNADGGAGGIVIVYSHNVLVEYNEVYRIYPTAAKVDGIGIDTDNDTYDCIVQFNLTHDNYASGYYVCRAGTGNVFRFNVSVNDGQGGLTMVTTNGAIFYNNTFVVYDNRAVANFFGGPPPKFVNNVLFAGEAGSFLLVYDNTTGQVVEGNSYYSPGGSFVIYGNGTYNSLSQFRAARGMENYGGVPRGLDVDPQLSYRPTDFALLKDSTRWMPLEGSPLLGAGLDPQAILGGPPMPATDFSGAPLTAPYPVGAFATPTPANYGSIGDILGLSLLLLPSNSPGNIGDSLPRLVDSSGSRNDAFQPAPSKRATKQAVSGYTVFHADGIDDVMLLRSLGLNTSGNVTIAAVLRSATDGFVVSKWTPQQDYLLQASPTAAIFARHSTGGAYSVATASVELDVFKTITGRSTTNGTEVYSGTDLLASDPNTFLVDTSWQTMGIFGGATDTNFTECDVAAIAVFIGNPPIEDIVFALQNEL